MIPMDPLTKPASVYRFAVNITRQLFVNNNSAFNIYVTAPFTVLLIILASSNRRRMRHSSLESPRQAASNGGSFILLQPLDAEIFNEMVNGAVM